MRLIDADRLKNNLSDIALQNAPLWADDNTEVYNAINDCIKAVDEQPTINTRIVKINGKLKVGLTRDKKKRPAMEDEL